MKATLVRIGNSQGVRIPKPFIAQCGFEGDIEMDVRGRELVLHAPRNPREGWSTAFRRMAKLGDDRLVDGALKRQTSWDDLEWEWK